MKGRAEGREQAARHGIASGVEKEQRLFGTARVSHELRRRGVEPRRRKKGEGSTRPAIACSWCLSFTCVRQPQAHTKPLCKAARVSETTVRGSEAGKTPTSHARTNCPWARHQGQGNRIFAMRHWKVRSFKSVEETNLPRRRVLMIMLSSPSCPGNCSSLNMSESSRSRFLGRSFRLFLRLLQRGYALGVDAHTLEKAATDQWSLGVYLWLLLFSASSSLDAASAIHAPSRVISMLSLHLWSDPGPDVCPLPSVRPSLIYPYARLRPRGNAISARALRCCLASTFPALWLQRNFCIGLAGPKKNRRGAHRSRHLSAWWVAGGATNDD